MKILVGISGGVDSAVAAKILKNEGHTVEGAVLKMHEYTELSAACIAADNVQIPLHTVDCTEEFDKIIRKNFVEEYLAGRTPNPCILCNQTVKFKLLYSYAMENGFDAIATGHYAKIVTVDNGAGKRYAFQCSEDKRKDQTYMLYRLPQYIIEKLMLPLGGMCKEDIRALAANYGIDASERADSQEICFLPNGNHAEYIESVAGKSPEGDFIDMNGNVLGKHRGIIRYTVGQRKGLGIALGERAFVTKIDPKNNTVTLSPKEAGASLVRISDMVHSGMDMPKEDVCGNFDVKLRYASSFLKCVARLHSDGTATLEFDPPQKAAPGQSAVLYRNGVVMCGGFITDFMSK